MNPESDPMRFAFDNERKFETFSLWEDAGFIPPEEYLYFIEFLHLSFVNGSNIVKADLLRQLAENITESVLLYRDSFFISDPEKMYRFAEDMKIEIEDIGDVFIAAKITAGIISEYYSHNLNFQFFLEDEEKSCFSHIRVKN